MAALSTWDNMERLLDFPDELVSERLLVLRDDEWLLWELERLLWVVEGEFWEFSIPEVTVELGVGLSWWGLKQDRNLSTL